MKKILTIALITLSVGAVYSQDLIVTTDSASLSCRITKVEDEYIHFIYNRNGVARKSRINRENVITYQFNHYTALKPSEEQIFAPASPPIPRWRFVFRGGYNRWIASNEGLPSEMITYVSNLKNGFCIGADADRFFNKFIGLGAKYTYYGNRNKDSFLDMKDFQNYHFIAPEVVLRIWDRKHGGAIIFEAAIGYLHFYNNSYAPGSDIILRANTVGELLGVGYERSLNKNVAIGGGVSFLYALAYQMNITEDGWKHTVRYDTNYPAGLSHFEAGLRLVFNAFGK